jgi:hypothetical protein
MANCQFQKHKKKQCGVDRMNDDTNNVMRPRIKSKQLTIQSVRESGNWMPVAYHWSRKRVTNSAPVQPRANLLIVLYKLRIIKIHELELMRWPVENKRDGSKQCADYGVSSHSGI